VGHPLIAGLLAVSLAARRTVWPTMSIVIGYSSVVSVARLVADLAAPTGPARFGGAGKRGNVVIVFPVGESSPRFVQARQHITCRAREGRIEFGVVSAADDKRVRFN
jgi:hypothetical protein